MKAIVHVDEEWGIGKANGLMFSIPADMKFFRETTTNHVVVMGSNTLKSFPGGRSLKNRTNIVLSTTMEEREDCIVVHSIQELLLEINKYPADEVYLIGGAKLYQALLPYCSEVLVTKVKAIGGADAFFHNLDEDKDFSLIYEGEWQETNGYQIQFTTYKNNNVIK